MANDLSQLSKLREKSDRELASKYVEQLLAIVGERTVKIPGCSVVGAKHDGMSRGVYHGVAYGGTLEVDPQGDIYWVREFLDFADDMLTEISDEVGRQEAYREGARALGRKTADSAAVVVVDGWGKSFPHEDEYTLFRDLAQEYVTAFDEASQKAPKLVVLGKEIEYVGKVRGGKSAMSRQSHTSSDSGIIRDTWERLGQPEKMVFLSDGRRPWPRTLPAGVSVVVIARELYDTTPTTPAVKAVATVFDYQKLAAVSRNEKGVAL